MNVFEKARILGTSGKYDVCGGEICKPPTFTRGLESLLGIIKAKSSDGRFCSLLKTLQTNKCKFDCKYCTNSSHCNNKSVAEFEPEELASLFSKLVQKNIVSGLFLSSGVCGDPDSSTEKMIKTVSLIRNKYHFNGYIHFKVLPGTSFHLIKQASESVDRMSVNIESPNQSRLSDLSDVKDYKNDLLRRQAWISKLSSVFQTTQFIVGAGGESDLEILRMAKWEYEKMNLKRCYYSSFNPVCGTPLENNKTIPAFRSNHLYNADFLIKDYGYKLQEIKECLSDSGMLPNKDPKFAIAEKIFSEPINIEDADYSELIRIPGIGLKTAKKIIDLREKKTFSFSDLRRSGAILRRASPFIAVDGERQIRLAHF